MKKIDPISTEIIRNAFISIAQDMNAVLIRSAYTPVIYEGKDCVVALLDEKGEVLGQSSGLPLFLGNLQVCVQETARIYGWDYFKEGDIFFVNDSFFTGTHLNDITIFAPIFWNKQLAGFSASRAHWLDVGAKDPGGSMDSSNIYQEGFRWPVTRLYENNEPKKEIIEFLRMNGRFGYSLIGDMNAQIAAGKTGEKRFKGILDRFGLDLVRSARNEIFKQSEELEKIAVKKIKNGSYDSEGFLDDDGLGSDPVKIKMKVTVEDEKITIDLDGSAKQTQGPVNCGFAQTISACRVAFKLLINPKRPVDGGTFKTLEVTAPQGSIFKAEEPAACQWYFSSLGLLIDAFVKALSPAIKDLSAAAHYGDSMVIFIGGVDPRNNFPFLSVEPTCGGWGGFPDSDGADALINNVNGGFKDLPIEVFENKYPVSIFNYGFRKDSGGTGKFRGGCGLYREYTINADGFVSLWFERSVTPAWGLFGGKDGIGPNVNIKSHDEKEKNLLKANGLQVKKGTVLTTYTGGGGGFEKPFERNPENVLNDVINKYVSIEKARDHYGVVIDEDLQINKEGTFKLRNT
ncbi:MAG: hydantoinase B/oxoprolinase family protein [Alphaproteobacteria bacterium]|jgi:N-methylhydantoinase B|nr:hydantoinase B/oxoprolinase family protein [Alphaproteobacteria bacterium]|tara:strand:- start:595 stop:2310 length:1716 start_codon:yes stop_codon:yes gene_type:complete